MTGRPHPDVDGQLTLFGDAPEPAPVDTTTDATGPNTDDRRAATGPEEDRTLFDHDPAAADPITVENQPAAAETPSTDAAAAETPSTDAVDAATDVEETAATTRPWEALPIVGTAADGHALIVTADGSFTPSGTRLTGPVDSIDKLASLIAWAELTPLGVPAQVWIVGIAACEPLGWVIDPGSEDDADDLDTLRTRAAELLRDRITDTLAPLHAAGWELRGDPGHVTHLLRRIGKATRMVDVIVEPYAWTWWNRDFGWGNRIGDLGILGAPTAGTYLPDDDTPAARELGRRLTAVATHLGILPGPTGARTGAAVLDKIRRERTRTGKGLVVDTPGTLPPLDNPPRADLEPPAGWTRVPDSGDLDDARVLVTIDQRAAYLASAGMLDLGHGTPTQHHGDAARGAAGAEKTPFGLWRVTLPAGDQFALPEKLPLPHPHMHPDRPVSTWVTTVSLTGLCAPVADGGMGLDLDDLGIEQAWVWPEQGRVLDKWTKTLRTARAAAVADDDTALKRFLSTTYKGYVGRMVNPDMWRAERMRHHHQPVWRAAIMAHARWRGRRVATRIGAEVGRWPIRTLTDSWVYLLPTGLDIGDDSDALGKMDVEKTVTLTDDHLDLFRTASNAYEIRQAIAAVYGTTGDDSEPDTAGE